MLRRLVRTIALLGLLATASGALRLTRVDDAGNVRFDPTLDRAVARWYLERAGDLLEAARSADTEAPPGPPTDVVRDAAPDPSTG